MTARERMRTLAGCEHVAHGICRDCCAAYMIAHAEAVREEAAKRIQIFQDIVGWQPGESRNKLIWDIEQSVRKIEVT